MAKAKTVFTCTECGGQSPKWQGQCPHCNAWNTLVETAVEATGKAWRCTASRASGVRPPSWRSGDVEASDFPRLPTLIDEFDRVLGGGLVEGGVVLIGGDPGIGKSTLLLQAAARLAEQVPVLYVTGEESAQQVALRARRLGVNASKVRLLPEIELEKIQAALAGSKPRIAVIDSIQTLYSSALTSAPGSVAQVRECAAQLTRFAKQSGTTIIFIGHVTKEGALAGPRVLEHMVDTVLYFEGETHTSFRLIRAFKNRFGAVNEIGVFAMTEKGLREVTNPSALFLSQHHAGVAGSCVMVTQEGTRPLLVELQALVDDAHGGAPKRLAVGLEQNRLAMLLAVLHRHAGIACLRPGRVPECGGWRADRGAGRGPRGDARHRLQPAQSRRCRTSTWSSARSGSRVRCGPCSAARNACARPPSSASPTPSSRRPTSRGSPLPGCRSSRWIGWWRRWTT